MEYSNIHQKFREDLRTYVDHELPAIGVRSFSYEEVEDDKDEIQLQIQVVNTGGTLATIEAECKTIVAKVIKLLKKQRPRLGGKCLRENAEDILNISGQIITGQISEDDDEGNVISQLIVCLGEISCTILIIGD